jgi:hypothetical protein
MIKYPLLILNFLGVFVFQMFFDDGVIIEDNTPTTLQVGETQLVEISVNKGEIAGFAKLELILPGGLSASPVETEGASFTFSGQKAKYIWMTLPDAQEFTVSYNITAEPLASGNLVVKGAFSYIKENQRVDYDLQSKLISIGLKGDDLADSGGDSEGDTENETGSVSQGATNDGSMQCKRYVTEISTNEYLVKLEVTNATLEGFAKIMEKVPPGFAIEEDDSDGAIATIESSGIKYVWFEAPSTSSFTVSYRMQAMSSMGRPEIDGTFSFVANNSPNELPVIDAYAGEDDTQLADATEEVADATEDLVAEVVDQVDEAVEETTDEIVADAEEVQAPIEESVDEIVETIAEEVQSQPEDTSVANNSETIVDTPRATSVPDPENGITYKVQIVAGHNTVGKSYFKKRHSFSEVFNIEQHEGWVKYTTGSHGEYQGARNERERINGRYNFNGPFVSAYNNGERITVQEALMISKQQWYQ